MPAAAVEDLWHISTCREAVLLGKSPARRGRHQRGTVSTFFELSHATAALLAIPSFVTALGLWLLAALAMFGIFALIGLPGRIRRRRLDRSTLFGEALVRNVTAENVMSRGPRYVRYDVTIQAPGRDPYDAHTSVVNAVTDIPSLAVGRSFPVKIDPEDTQNFCFVHDHR